jgi:hypothetical protein
VATSSHSTWRGMSSRRVPYAISQRLSQVNGFMATGCFAADNGVECPQVIPHSRKGFGTNEDIRD